MRGLLVVASLGCVARIEGGMGPTDAGAGADAVAVPVADAHAVADAGAGRCPASMLPVDEGCMDLYEAPNRAGALPLIMYDFVEAEAWCGARGKRLCYDDEWQHACEGSAGWAYPYGPARLPGECNDDKTWIVYSQTALNYWPFGASAPEVESLEELYVRSDPTAAAEVQRLYQGEAGGDSPGCFNPDFGVLDLQGNVEEWTRRRDGGSPSFHGNLKGRYWAEARTCQSGVTTHGDGFRFYEIGFRCCLDRP